MICCIAGVGIVAALVAARRFLRTRVLGHPGEEDPAEWRLHPEAG